MPRILLNIVTVIAILLGGSSLLNSWVQPPPTTQLDLIQTNLTLQAIRTLDVPQSQDLARTLLGSTDPIASALKQYRTASDRMTERLAPFQATTETSDGTDPAPSTAPAEVVAKEQASLDELNLRLGLLLAQQGETAEAQDYWETIQTESLTGAADALSGLWDTQFLRIVPNAEVELQRSLDGWFEGTALSQLYRLQQRTDELVELEEDQDLAATAALNRLAAVTGIPFILGIVGAVILVGWFVGVLRRSWPVVGEAWQVPWSLVTMQGVMSVWFVGFWLTGQIVPSIYLLAVVGTDFSAITQMQQAIALLLTYAVSAAIGLTLVYRASKTPAQSASPEADLSDMPDTDEPATTDLFKVTPLDKWPLWGVGGYLSALPLVLLAGLLAQWLLPESGGGNPILPLIIHSEGWGPKIIFCVVVAVFAPIFEETLFRGFLLPSLTKVMPVWLAIVGSGLLFALVHLNFSDLLPLTVLGIVLGIVYSRSRNLLAPILLHSCWNAGTFATLIYLGGGN